MLEYTLMVLLLVTALFLILLILVQRGRGGGLAGAFGGLGGQSAFGTKAGDLFTRITIGVAAFWILLCAASVKLLSSEGGRLAPGHGAAAQQQTPITTPAPVGGSARPGAAGGGQAQPSGTPAGNKTDTGGATTSAPSGDSSRGGAAEPSSGAEGGAPSSGSEPAKSGK